MAMWCKGLASEPFGSGSSPETIDFLTNSSEPATNALVSLFTKQYKLASGLGEGETLCALMPRSLTHVGEHLVAVRLYDCNPETCYFKYSQFQEGPNKCLHLYTCGNMPTKQTAGQIW